MNSSIRNIAIRNPCSENWSVMTDAGTGKFCDRCQKNVIDLSGLSNMQIIDLLSSSNRMCGRLNPIQLDSINSQLAEHDFKTISWTRFAIAASIIGLFTFFKTEAKPKKVITEQAPIKPEIKKKIGVPDSLSSIIVRGQVIAKEDNLPLPGVFVTIKGTNKKVQTDQKGYFELHAPTSAQTLLVQFIGYETQEVSINKKNPSPILITIKMASMIMGEIVITPRQPKKSGGKL